MGSKATEANSSQLATRTSLHKHWSVTREPTFQMGKPAPGAHFDTNSVSFGLAASPPAGRPPAHTQAPRRAHFRLPVRTGSRAWPTTRSRRLLTGLRRPTTFEKNKRQVVLACV